MRLVCNYCMEALEPFEFGIDRQNKNGLKATCKKCVAEKKREKYHKTKAIELPKILAQQREAYHNKPDVKARRDARNRAYYKKHSEKYLEIARSRTALATPQYVSYLINYRMKDSGVTLPEIRLQPDFITFNRELLLLKRDGVL